jgi:starvation-inducible outer membrane lipoprotein
MMSAPSSIHSAAARWLGALVVVAWALLSGCATLPGDVQRTRSDAMPDVATTPLAQLASVDTRRAAPLWAAADAQRT